MLERKPVKANALISAWILHI